MRRIRELLPLLPLAACYVFIAWANPRLVPQLPLVLCFLAAFVVLPAVGLAGLLLRGPLSLTDRLGLGGPAALASLFAFAYAGAALRQPDLIWAQPALGLAACLVTLRPRPAKADQPAPSSHSDCPPTPWPDLLLMTAVLAGGLALAAPKFLAVSEPTAGLTLDYYNDDIGQSAIIFSCLRALEHGLPVLQPYLSGTTLSYHLLYHYCYAACAMLTGAHPLDLVLFLWPPLLWLLMATGLVAGCRRLAGLQPGEAAMAALLVCFCAGWGFYSTPGVQMFSYQHTFFMGLPALLLFACALYGLLSGRRERLFALHAGVSFLVCAATKATLMLMLPLALLPVLLLRTMKRQSGWREWLLAALTVLSVLALKLTIYPDTARVAIRAPQFGKLFMGALGNLGELAWVLGPFVVLLLWMREDSPVLRLALRRDRQYHLFLLCYTLIAAVLLKAFNFVGADFYFFWHGRVLLFLAFAPAAAHLLQWRQRGLSMAVAVVLILGLALTAQTQLWPSLFRGDPSWVPADARAKTLDDGEREALRWAAANLDRRAVLITNKSVFLGSYLGGHVPIDMYDVPGISGLQGFAWASPGLGQADLELAGARLARQKAFLAATDLKTRARALADLPEVDYYFHSTRLDPGFTPPECLTETHRTASLTIYRNACRAAIPAGPEQQHKE